MQKEPSPFRCGYIAITGLPNVGKSTLLNRIIDEPLAIVTPKAQTTRNRILGIRTTKSVQSIFIDTPGLCDEINDLNRYLNEEIGRALADADIVLVLADARAKADENEKLLLQKIASWSGTRFLAINKSDLLRSKDLLLGRIAELSALCPFEEIIPVSALSGEGVERLIGLLDSRLPEAPALYPEDEISTSNLRFIVAEMIREQVLMKTQKEVPYSSAVVVEKYQEAEKENGVVRIEANIFVERESQKGIVIGAGAKMLKSIGEAARIRIENFLSQRVYLRLNVKVRKNWSRDKKSLADLGYE